MNLQSTLSRDPPSDVGIVLKELTPRRRLREEHVLLTVDFPGTQHEFTLVLERIRGRGKIQLSILYWRVQEVIKFSFKYT